MGWQRLVRIVQHRVIDADVSARAAQMSFYFFLSVFPALLILTATLDLFFDAQWLVRDTVLERLALVAPAAIVQALARVMDNLGSVPGAPLTSGILIALWAASSGMVATIRGLNQAYAIEEERPWWRRRLVGLALTLVLMTLTMLAMLLIAHGVPLAGALAQHLGFGPTFVLIWQIAQWPAIFCFVLLAFSVLYHFAPHRPHGRWQWVRPGTLLAIALWLVASLGLKFYVANFGAYNVTYGSLGTVIVVQLWFFFTSVAILVGAEINAEFESTMTHFATKRQ